MYRAYRVADFRQSLPKFEPLLVDPSSRLVFDALFYWSRFECLACEGVGSVLLFIFANSHV